LLTKSK